jgi:hypothetical protein
MGGSVLSNNGGNLLGNNGGNLISNNGGSYRLANAVAEPDALIADVDVVLLDATGAVVKTPDGRELRTRTDASGRYTFTDPLPAYHIVVQAGRSPQQAAVSRIVAGGVKEANLDVATTLVAGYVLEKYVKTQPEPQTTLNRLPASVEAETVAIAAAAAANLGAVQLTPTAVANSLEALRKLDTNLDNQLEVVRKLLIVAGLSDLGEGQPGLQVTLPGIQHVLQAVDGNVNAFSIGGASTGPSKTSARSALGTEP